MLETKESQLSMFSDMTNALNAVSHLYPSIPECVDRSVAAIEKIKVLTEDLPPVNQVGREFAKLLMELRQDIVTLCKVLKRKIDPILMLTKRGRYDIVVLYKQVYLLSLSLLCEKLANEELKIMSIYNENVIGFLDIQDYIATISKYSEIYNTYTMQDIDRDLQYQIAFVGIAANNYQLEQPISQMLERVFKLILDDFGIEYEQGREFSYYLNTFSVIPELGPEVMYYAEKQSEVEWWFVVKDFIRVLEISENLTPFFSHPEVGTIVQPDLHRMLDEFAVYRIKAQREAKTDMSAKTISGILNDLLLYTRTFKLFTDDMWTIMEQPADVVWMLLQKLNIIPKTYRLPKAKEGATIEAYVQELPLNTSVAFLSDLLVATATPATLRHAVLSSSFTDMALNYYAIYVDAPALSKASFNNDMWAYMYHLISNGGFLQ